jgi:hypothetical protein
LTTIEDRSRHTGFTSKQKNGLKVDVKIAHQPGQPDEPHTEIFSSPENVGKDAPEKSELIGEVKSELLELASRFQQFHSTLRYLEALYHRPYVRRAYPYYFGEASSDIRIMADTVRMVEKYITAEDTTATLVITEVALVTSILESIQINRLLTTFVQINLSQL